MESSKSTARAALTMALSATREEETGLKSSFSREGLQCAAVDFGGEYTASIMKLIERTVVAAKREGLIGETHHEEGAVAGAAREAAAQISSKALGFNIGGKIGVVRSEQHVAVAVFFGVGLLHLNEVAVGLGHRAI